MASQIDICNSALVKIGAMPINALNDGSKEGNLLGVRWTSALAYVLREHPWKCATTRVALSPIPVTPVSDPTCLQQWQYEVQLPADYIRLVLNDDDKLWFKIEGTTFLTNNPNPVIRYVYMVTDTSVLDTHLAEVLAWYLAQDICLAIIQNTAVADRMTKQYQQALSKAKFIDAASSKAITQDEYFYEQIRLQANHL